MDLGLNNLQRLICHKPNNQRTNRLKIITYKLFVILSVDDSIYAYYTGGGEHSGERINGCHSCNAKLFQRIDPSGIRLCKM